MLVGSAVGVDVGSSGAVGVSVGVRVGRVVAVGVSVGDDVGVRVTAAVGDGEGPVAATVAGGAGVGCAHALSRHNAIPAAASNGAHPLPGALEFVIHMTAIIARIGQLAKRRQYPCGYLLNHAVRNPKDLRTL